MFNNAMCLCDTRGVFSVLEIYNLLSVDTVVKRQTGAENPENGLYCTGTVS